MYAIYLIHVFRHLARNPFICDCNLRWLADYLHKNPIETSGARCDAPKRMHRRRIEALRDEKFKCKLFLFICLLFLFFVFNFIVTFCYSIYLVSVLKPKNTEMIKMESSPSFEESKKFKYDMNNILF